MLYTRNALHFRKFFKEEVAKEKYPIDLKFIGSTAPGKNNDGFAKLIYGNRKDLGKLLGTIALNVAADDQAIYELIQNADDCKSSFFSVSYNEEYLLCINNGNYFSDRDMSAIINVAGNYKDGEDIGTFGIGFKILHRLVGADDGREAIINDYAGPIIFSWNKFFQLEAFLKEDEIKVGFDLKKDSENPWLVKLIYTCFPSHLDEKLKLQNYDTEGVKFSKDELSEMRAFLKQSLQNVNLKETNNLKNGSIFFLKLGKGKSKFLDEGIDKIKSGLSYSFKFLNSLHKIYINGEEIKAKAVLDYTHSFPIGSNEFIDINPKNKNRDIKFTFAFYRDYKNAVDLQNELAPNLYTFFSMDEEKNGFSFLLHCNAFDMNNDRRKLQANSQINEILLPLIAQNLIKYSDKQKENNRSLFLSLYANFLLSKDPKNKPHINNSFSRFIHQYISKNIPTKNGFSDNAQSVKINKLNPKLNLDLTKFGLSDIQWFEWDNEADKLLINEATKSEKLGIKEWDIRDVIENSDIDSINNWIASSDERIYREFLRELEENNFLRNATKEHICQIKLFKFSNGKFYSFVEIVSVKDLGKTSFNFSNCFYINNKTKDIRNELIKLEMVVSELSSEDYPTIFSSVTLPEDKKIYELIAEKCKINDLSAKEKKKLFLNFINEETKFDNVAEGTLKDLELFCDSNTEIKPLNRLIGNIRTPNWLNAYKIKEDEYFSELNPYLLSEAEDIFTEIHLQNQNNIIAEITTAEEIKSLIKLYQDNQKSFFNEFIIRKENNVFVIDEKTNETYQVQSADKEARKFLDENCADNLFVLPYEFVEKHKDEEGIIKADDLHSLILEFVDVDEHKDILVDIVKYKAKHKFLQGLSEFRFNSETKYVKENYEYKILDLACSELKENDFQKFKDKVVIETDNQDLKLSDIPPISDIIKIDEYEISLAKILPYNYENSDYLSSLINQFIRLGLNKERIGNLFGLSEEPESSDIFQIFSDQVTTLENAEQLAFLFLYGLYIEKIDFNQFKALNLNEEEIDLGTDKYLTDFDFIKQSEILHQKYGSVTEIFKDWPIVIEDNVNLLLIKEPYFDADKFICPCIEEDLSDEQKLKFVEFLFNQWNKKSKKTTFKNIDWSKIYDKQTQKILGFDPRTSVYPSEYADFVEVLPDYLIKWVNNEETKIDFLTDLGVWTEKSVIVELRKYLSGEIKDFKNNLLEQETRFNEDDFNLLCSLDWLTEKEITLKTLEQLTTIKKVVDIINENMGNNYFEIEDNFDFDELKENSIEWKSSHYESIKQDSDFAIFLFEGEMPKTISINDYADYVFYSLYDGNTAVDDQNNIYINKNVDVNKELQKLELNQEIEFNFNGLWKKELEDLRNENAKLKKSKEVNLGIELAYDISKNDQKESNREAKEIVKEKLEREDFEFTEGIGEYSTIDGVFKDDVEFPLVVKSYKYQDEPLKIGANEWIQLMKPNSMFWLHFGNRKLGCLKLYELLRNQDKLTISFSTENLDVEDRLDKFAELLHYFGNVHFDFNSVKPSDYSVAKDLSDYRFDERRNEEDLSGDDEELL